MEVASSAAARASEEVRHTNIFSVISHSICTAQTKPLCLPAGPGSFGESLDTVYIFPDLEKTYLMLSAHSPTQFTRKRQSRYGQSLDSEAVEERRLLGLDS